MKTSITYFTLLIGIIIGFLASMVLLSAESSKVPDELRSFLDRVSNFSKNDDISSDDISSSRKKVRLAVNRLPAPQREVLADQIALAEWSLNAFDLLSEEISSDELLSQFIQARTLTESIPISVPSALEEAVQTRTDHLVDRAKKHIDQMAMSQPTQNLKSLREGALIADVLDQAGLLDDTSTANKLEVRLQIVEWDKEKKQLKSEKYGSKEELDIARYNIVEQGYGIFELAVDLDVDLPNHFVTSFRKYSNLLAKEQKQAQEKKRANYQLWAIDQIEQANKMIGENGAKNIGKWLKRAKNSPPQKKLQLLNYLEKGRAPNFRFELLKAAGKQGLTVDKHNLSSVIDKLDIIGGWKRQNEMTQGLTADALLLHLMPVDESLLDRPVAALYSESFQKAWTYLVGTNYRLKVAKEGAKISKKQLAK